MARKKVKKVKKVTTKKKATRKPKSQPYLVELKGGHLSFVHAFAKEDIKAGQLVTVDCEEGVARLHVKELKVAPVQESTEQQLELPEQVLDYAQELNENPNSVDMQTHSFDEDFSQEVPEEPYTQEEQLDEEQQP